jgi:hypothetical protein
MIFASNFFQNFSDYFVLNLSSHSNWNLFDLLLRYSEVKTYFNVEYDLSHMRLEFHFNVQGPHKIYYSFHHHLNSLFSQNHLLHQFPHHNVLNADAVVYLDLSFLLMHDDLVILHLNAIFNELSFNYSQNSLLLQCSNWTLVFVKSSFVIPL